MIEFSIYHIIPVVLLGIMVGGIRVNNEKGVNRVKENQSAGYSLCLFLCVFLTSSYNLTFFMAEMHF